MIDLTILQKNGVSRDAWRSLLDTGTNPASNEKLEKFKKRMWERVSGEISDNLRSYRIFHAIDLVWDTPLRQVSPTLLHGIMSRFQKEKNEDELLKILKEFDLNDYISDDIDPKTLKPTGRKKLDVPAFFQIIIPVVRQYVIIRTAKIINDRALNPMLKYEPLRSTPDMRAKCELLTSRINIMAGQYGYPAIRRNAVLKMMLYNTVLQFIQEEWDEEKQAHMVNGSEKEIITKEGLRYHIPHPSRTYWDRAYPVNTLNTDTGCSYSGYWRVMKYKDVSYNENFFNRGAITFGTNYLNDNSLFFTTVYPCVMSFPEKTASAVSSTMQNDEEANLTSLCYSHSNDDQGVVVVEHFEKIIPKDVGLGDYEHPIWARFVMAGGGTIIYAAPLPGIPVVAYADIYDSGRLVNSSFALELIPIQDAMSNSLSQAILSAKQNLASLVLLDKHMVDEQTIEQLRNPGESHFRSRKYVPVDGRKINAQLGDITKASTSISFPYLNVNDCIMILNVLLNILERVSQISAQEVGAAASHQQSAEEQRLISSSSSNRLKFSAAPVDEATDAWKRQLYYYLMAYGDDDIYAQMPADNPITTKQLESMGFTVETIDTNDPKEPTVRMVRGKKTAIDVVMFAANRDGVDRTDTVAVAGAMSQMVMAISTNPAFLQAVGAPQIVELMNQVLSMMGLPRDFKLRTTTVEQQATEVQTMAQQMVQLIQQSSQQTIQQVAEGMKPVLETIQKMAEQLQATSALSAQNKQQLDQLAAAVDNIAKASLGSPETEVASYGPEQPTPEGQLANVAPVQAPA